MIIEMVEMAVKQSIDCYKLHMMAIDEIINCVCNLYLILLKKEHKKVVAAVILSQD